MSIDATMVRRALAAVRAAFGGSDATVVINGKTAAGVATARNNAGALTGVGYTDADGQAVYVVSDDIGTVVNGQRGTVNGNPAEVVTASTSANVLTKIEFRYRPEATGARPS